MAPVRASGEADADAEQWRRSREAAGSRRASGEEATAPRRGGAGSRRAHEARQPSSGEALPGVSKRGRQERRAALDVEAGREAYRAEGGVRSPATSSLEKDAMPSRKSNRPSHLVAEVPTALETSINWLMDRISHVAGIVDRSVGGALSTLVFDAGSGERAVAPELSAADAVGVTDRGDLFVSLETPVTSRKSGGQIPSGSLDDTGGVTWFRKGITDFDEDLDEADAYPPLDESVHEIEDALEEELVDEMAAELARGDRGAAGHLEAPGVVRLASNVISKLRSLEEGKIVRASIVGSRNWLRRRRERNAMEAALGSTVAASSPAVGPLGSAGGCAAAESAEKRAKAAVRGAGAIESPPSGFEGGVEGASPAVSAGVEARPTPAMPGGAEVQGAQSSPPKGTEAQGAPSTPPEDASAQEAPSKAVVVSGETAELAAKEAIATAADAIEAAEEGVEEAVAKADGASVGSSSAGEPTNPFASSVGATKAGEAPPGGAEAASPAASPGKEAASAGEEDAPPGNGAASPEKGASALPFPVGGENPERAGKTSQYRVILRGELMTMKERRRANWMQYGIASIGLAVLIAVVTQRHSIIGNSYLDAQASGAYVNYFLASGIIGSVFLLLVICVIFGALRRFHYVGGRSALWGRRRSRVFGYVMALAAVHGLNLVFWISLDFVQMASRCDWLQHRLLTLSVLQWICWNTFFFISVCFAHDLCEVHKMQRIEQDIDHPIGWFVIRRRGDAAEAEREALAATEAEAEAEAAAEEASAVEAGKRRRRPLSAAADAGSQIASKALGTPAVIVESSKSAQKRARSIVSNSVFGRLWGARKGAADADADAEPWWPYDDHGVPRVRGIYAVGFKAPTEVIRNPEAWGSVRPDGFPRPASSPGSGPRPSGSFGDGPAETAPPSKGSIASMLGWRRRPSFKRPEAKRVKRQPRLPPPVLYVDMPLRHHLVKLPVWMAGTALVIVNAVRVAHTRVPNIEGSKCSVAPQALCELDSVAYRVNLAFAFMVLVFFMLFLACRIRAVRDSRKRSHVDARPAELLGSLYGRRMMLTFVPMIVCVFVATVVDRSRCDSMLVMRIVLLPLQGLGTGIVLTTTYSFSPRIPGEMSGAALAAAVWGGAVARLGTLVLPSKRGGNGRRYTPGAILRAARGWMFGRRNPARNEEQRVPEAWMQVPVWTEGAFPRAVAARAAVAVAAGVQAKHAVRLLSEPVFCVETAITALYWSQLVYDAGSMPTPTRWHPRLARRLGRVLLDEDTEDRGDLAELIAREGPLWTREATPRPDKRHSSGSKWSKKLLIRRRPDDLDAGGSQLIDIEDRVIVGAWPTAENRKRGFVVSRNSALGILRESGGEDDEVSVLDPLDYSMVSAQSLEDTHDAGGVPAAPANPRPVDDVPLVVLVGDRAGGPAERGAGARRTPGSHEEVPPEPSERERHDGGSGSGPGPSSGPGSPADSEVAAQAGPDPDLEVGSPLPGGGATSPEAPGGRAAAAGGRPAATPPSPEPAALERDAPLAPAPARGRGVLFVDPAPARRRGASADASSVVGSARPATLSPAVRSQRGGSCQGEIFPVPSSSGFSGGAGSARRTPFAGGSTSKHSHGGARSSRASVQYRVATPDLAESRPSLRAEVAHLGPNDQVEIVWDVKTDTKAILASGAGGVVVAFAGTSSMANVRTDLRLAQTVLLPKRRGPIGKTFFGAPVKQVVRVHAGFYDAYRGDGFREVLLSRVLRKLDGAEASETVGLRRRGAGGDASEGGADPPSEVEASRRLPGSARRPRRVLITGHSLGGALATLAARDVAELRPEADVRLYTFGSPRVGNRAFAAEVARLVPHAYAVINVRDPVPRVPKGLSYKRSGDRVIFLSNGDMAVNAVRRDSGGFTSVAHHLLINYRASFANILKAQFGPRAVRGGSRGAASLARHLDLDAVFLGSGLDLASLRDPAVSPALLRTMEELDALQRGEQTEEPDTLPDEAIKAVDTAKDAVVYQAETAVAEVVAEVDVVATAGCAPFGPCFDCFCASSGPEAQVDTETHIARVFPTRVELLHREIELLREAIDESGASTASH